MLPKCVESGFADGFARPSVKLMMTFLQRYAESQDSARQMFLFYHWDLKKRIISRHHSGQNRGGSGSGWEEVLGACARQGPVLGRMRDPWKFQISESRRYGISKFLRKSRIYVFKHLTAAGSISGRSLGLFARGAEWTSIEKQSKRKVCIHSLSFERVGEWANHIT